MLLSERIEDRVVKLVNEKFGLTKELVDSINQFQWKIVHEGTSLYRDIEITGLGRITVKPNTIERRISKYEKELIVLLDTLHTTIPVDKKNKIEKEIERIKEQIEFLKGKRNEV